VSVEDQHKRIDAIQEQLTACRQDVGEKMLVMERDSIEKLTRLQSTVDSLEKRIPEWITRVEFTPVKMITYGLVSIILTSVFTAVVALVVTGGAR